MRIAVMGVGDVGSHYGGSLVLAGEDVTFIVKSARLDSIRANGLALSRDSLRTILSQEAMDRLEDRDLTLSVNATDDPQEVDPVDLLLFCVKTYDLEAAAAQAAPLVGAGAVVIAPQDGIDIVERLTPFFGEDAIIPGIKNPYKFAFGELAGGASPRTERLLALFQRAGFLVELRENIQLSRWEKFIGKCATGGAIALMRLPWGPIRDCPESVALCRGVMEEAAQVAVASGVDLPEHTVDNYMDNLMGLPPHITSSALRDVQNGRRLELDDLNGAVVRLGRELGVPTPLNFAVYAALKPHINGSV
jgi:2-dehydropantoate 2-reductase